jgi:hypothetical protein
MYNKRKKDGELGDTAVDTEGIPDKAVDADPANG